MRWKQDTLCKCHISESKCRVTEKAVQVVGVGGDTDPTGAAFAFDTYLVTLHELFPLAGPQFHVGQLRNREGRWQFPRHQRWSPRTFWKEPLVSIHSEYLLP